MQDVLYGEKGLPKGSVPHLLATDDTAREELRQLLKQYADVFPSQLPKDMPCDCGLGEVHERHTKPGISPIRHQQYRHLPAE